MKALLFKTLLTCVFDLVSIPREIVFNGKVLNFVLNQRWLFWGVGGGGTVTILCSFR